MRDAGATEALRQTRAVVADLESELAGIAESTAAGPDDEHDAEGSTLGYERARVGALLAAARRRLSDLEQVSDLERVSDPERLSKLVGRSDLERRSALERGSEPNGRSEPERQPTAHDGASGSRRCVECGQLIPQERIEVLPATSCCVGCAEAAQRQTTPLDRFL